MRVFLANMPITFNKKENLEPPLGILYLGSVLKEGGHEIFLKDYEIEYFCKEDLIRFVIDNKIELVGISFRTASYKSAKIFVKAFDKIRERILIIAGGHHATAFPKQTILDLSCDIVVKGEGESTFKELVEALEDKKSLNGIQSITYRMGEQITDNENRNSISNLDALPFPDRGLLPYERYTVATVITSRGCPFSCIYCDKGISTRQVRFRSPENIYCEILEISRKYPQKDIYFVDDHFFLAKERLNKIFDLIERHNLKFNWICQARADGVDFEMLKRAKKNGCKLIMYGIESGDPKELKYMRKETMVEEARNTLYLTKKGGIKVRANFMLGFPISTHETMKNTIYFAKSAPIDVVRFFSVAPLPNTELWDRIYGKGVDLNKIKWDEFDFYTPTYPTSELSREDIICYVGAAYIHVLKQKVFLELSLGFLFRFIKLCLLSFKKRRLRGNLSLTFPSTINLLLDLKTVMHSKNLYAKICFLAKAFCLEYRLCQHKGER